MLPDGETVADSTELKVAKCFPSKVSGGRRRRGSCCRARWGDVGTEPRSSAESFFIPCNWLVPDSPFREGLPSSPIPVAAANHLLALITVLTLHPWLAFGVGLWHRGPSWDQLPSPLTQRLPSVQVNLSFSEQRALVGSRLRLKVQAAPGSLCAVYAVDQRTRSSGPKGKLNPSMVSLE